MKSLNYSVVDAFTAKPFGGNPAAVVPLSAPLPDELLQAIAGEFNLAETAYPLRLDDRCFELRWFTPTREVPLCGHATLASAHALWEAGVVRGDEEIRFVTHSSGELVCRPTADGRIRMDFPSTPPQPAALPANAAAVLGIAGDVERVLQCIGTTTMNLTLRLPTAQHVRDCRPDFSILATWHPIGVTVTAPGDEAGVDFVSRFFAPQAGIPEDPVTGSAHCALAPYWSQQLSKLAMSARQLSPRGGELQVELHNDRVHLIGRAVTTMRGEIVV